MTLKEENSRSTLRLGPPIRFEDAETQTVVECGYDSQGRRFEKKVTVAGTATLHHRYIYRGYLQIAALDLTRSAHPALWLVTWDPAQPTATQEKRNSRLGKGLFFFSRIRQLQM